MAGSDIEVTEQDLDNAETVATNLGIDRATGVAAISKLCAAARAQGVSVAEIAGAVPPQVTGRAKVRALVFAPLVEMGLRRKRGVSVAAHDKAMTNLADRLAYLTTENLAGVRTYIERLAASGKGTEWPDAILIVTCAHRLQAPPVLENDYAKSVIRSEMGIRAQAEGWLVELFQIAKRVGPPPSKYIVTQLREEARKNAGRCARVREYIERGNASSQDVAWLAQYDRDRAEAVAILEAKRAERGE